MIRQPARELVDLAVDAEVDNELDPEISDDGEISVGQLIEAVGSEDAVPFGDMTVGGRIPAEVTPIERSFERDKSLSL
jgi:hypothetical protein